MLTDNHKLAMTVGALEGVRLLCRLSPVAEAVRVHNVECNGQSTDLTLDPSIVNGLILAALDTHIAIFKRPSRQRLVALIAGRRALAEQAGGENA